MTALDEKSLLMQAFLCPLASDSLAANDNQGMKNEQGCS